MVSTSKKKFVICFLKKIYNFKINKIMTKLKIVIIFASVNMSFCHSFLKFVTLYNYLKLKKLQKKTYISLWLQFETRVNYRKYNL